VAKIELEAPEGVDLSKVDVNKLFSTFLKSRISGQARDQAVRKATKQLIDAHKPEYQRYLDAGMPK